MHSEAPVKWLQVTHTWLEEGGSPTIKGRAMRHELLNFIAKFPTENGRKMVKSV